jgi:hypothetical protein
MVVALLFGELGAVQVKKETGPTGMDAGTVSREVIRGVAFHGRPKPKLDSLPAG